MKTKIRKIVTFVEEIRTEMGKPVNPPTRRAAAAAVIQNPVSYTHLTLPTICSV